MIILRYLFVAKWGGYFIEEKNHLVYISSGKEQTLVVGSGRGLPYHTRPNNQNKLGDVAQPQILTPSFMAQFQGNAQELFDLLKKEAELVFYQKKLADKKVDLNSFLRDYRMGDRATILHKYQISIDDRIDWMELLDPAKAITPQAFPDFIRTYLEKDIAEAELGNQTGAVASTIDTYKELQAPLNAMLDQEKFSPKEYVEDFFGTFKHTYSFLTIGAPIIRQKQLLALAKAGVVEFLAPDMQIERKNGEFFAYSKQDPKRSFFAKNLIEARLAATSLEHTQNPLLIQMREKGYLTPHCVTFDNSKHSTGAIQVNRKTHQLVAENGEILSHIYCYGVPLEGIDWLNATSPPTQKRGSDFLFSQPNRSNNLSLKKESSRAFFFSVQFFFCGLFYDFHRFWNLFLQSDRLFSFSHPLLRRQLRPLLLKCR